jgi:hypothetical protein
MMEVYGFENFGHTHKYIKLDTQKYSFYILFLIRKKE